MRHVKNQRPQRIAPAAPSAEQDLATVPDWFAGQFAPALAMLFGSDDPDGPHQTRVVLRQLRAILTGYSEILSAKVLDKLHRRCRLYFRLIGPVRDADVLWLQMTRKSDIKAARKAADVLRHAVRRALTHEDIQKFPTEVLRLLGGKASLRKSDKARALRSAGVGVIAARALQAAFATVLRYPADLAALDPETLHDFRKDLKTLRYLADHFAAVWPGAAQDGFMDQLRRLQDALGDLNDATLTKAAGIDSVVEEDVLLAQAKEIWRVIVAAGPWWLPTAAGALGPVG